MAYRKRPKEDDTQTNPPNHKRVKSERCVDNHPPAFWDSLSEVVLTRRALRELDRRNSINPPSLRVLPAASCRPLTRKAAQSLASREIQFAQGREQDRRLAQYRGPLTRQIARKVSLRIAQFAISEEQDLSDLRGFSAPPGSITAMGPKSSSKSSQSSKSKQSSTPTSRSSAYDLNFERHLIDNNIYPPFYNHGDQSYPEPGNLSEIQATILEPRASLSPSQVTPAQFRNFNVKNNTPSEGTVMSSIVPMITGDKNIPSEGHIPFTNLTSMTQEATVKPVPDFFDGAPPESLHKVIRDHENTRIVPTKHPAAPVLPNFFLEAKAPSGGVDVARRQAMADGAYGARAMHAVQNYALDEPVYDGNAYAYSSTYHSGNLKLYGHHVSAPATANGKPQYHMTQIGGYDLTHSQAAYREGTTALRNTRDLAKRQRDQVISAANARSIQSSKVLGEASTESRTSPASASPSTNYSSLAYTGSQNDTRDEADANYTTSFTSNIVLNEPEAGSKRTVSRSPPEASTRSEKRKGKASTEGEERQGKASGEYWMWSTTASNWYHIHEDGSCEWYRAPRKGRGKR